MPGKAGQGRERNKGPKASSKQEENQPRSHLAVSLPLTLSARPDHVLPVRACVCGRALAGTMP